MSLPPLAASIRRASSLYRSTGTCSRPLGSIYFNNASQLDESNHWLSAQVAPQLRPFSAYPSALRSAWDALKKRQIEKWDDNNDKYTIIVHPFENSKRSAGSLQCVCVCMHAHYAAFRCIFERATNFHSFLSLLHAIQLRLLPSIMFDDKLPNHVYIGKEILRMQIDSEKAKQLSDSIDSQLEVRYTVYIYIYVYSFIYNQI